MNSDFEIRSLDIKNVRVRARVESFLQANGLRLDTVEFYFGVFRLDEDEILAGGGLYRDIIKCVAVREDLREEHLFNMLVSHIVSEAYAEGHYSLKVYTKPANLAIFQSLGFKLIAQSPQALFMQNSLSELQAYKAYLQQSRESHHARCNGRDAGLIVMNANPFTLGHRYLVEQAAGRVGELYVIVVRENRSMFDYAHRLSMVREGCADLANVCVLEGSDYQISEATFPTYFLKQVSDASDEQIQLDLDVCLRHIVPSLGVTSRFVGSEPSDLLTCSYNRHMHRLLPPQGVEVVELPRVEKSSAPISASTFRRTWDLSLLPASSVPYAIGVRAAQSLQQELDLTPKPGLIDCDDNGAHADMTYALMQRSIRALEPFFVEFAKMGLSASLPSVADVVSRGLVAEQAMLEATSGVNTHKGALFALGLSCLASAHAYGTEGRVSADSFRADIVALAAQFPQPQGTHGAAVRSRYQVPGALDVARTGYSQLFADWLPFLRSVAGDAYAQHKLLLRIMATLDDNNLYHRGGADKARQVQQQSTALLESFTLDGLHAMCRQLRESNLSPGGSADMLALTLFADAIIKE